MVEVTHVSPALFGDDGYWGGGERYAMELAAAMSSHVRTRLVSFGPELRQLRRGNLEIRVLPARRHWRDEQLNPLSLRLARELLRARIVHAHQYRSIVTDACLAVGALAGRSVYCTDHGGSASHCADRLRLASLLDGFLAVSAFSATEFPQFAGCTSIVHGGVDVARFHPTDERREREVAFVGRLLPHKGIDVLVRALDATTALHVYGRVYDAAYFDELRRLARGKNVHFHESPSDAEIRAAYRRARVVVLPSVYDSAYAPRSPRPELLGLVLLEAMACGTPVVATRVGGMPEIVVDGETGLLVAPGDVQQLRDAIRTLVAGEATWAAMSVRAVEWVRARFTWDRVAERCLDAYGARQ
jgi:glycosyltransferase involved in cell wall biosynthesis